MKITFCTFKRTPLSTRESGILIEAPNQLIVDQMGKEVIGPTWYRRQEPYRLCVDVPEDTKPVEKGDLA